MTTNEWSRRGFAGAVAVALAIGSGLTGARAATINVPADYTTIEAAVAAAAAGDTIEVAAGTYVLAGTVSMNKTDLTIQGAPSLATVVQVSKAAVPSYGFSIAASGATIRGLKIEKTDKTGVQNLIYIGANDATIQDCEISGQYVLGDNDVSRAFEVAYGISGILIDGNTIHNLRQPGYFNGSEASPTTGTISDNYVYATRGWVIAGANMTFTGNSWGTGANANYLDIAILSVTPAAYYPDLAALSAANNDAAAEDQRQTPTLLSDVYVDDSAAAGGDGTLTKPYQTITAGVARVMSGGTVHVAAGTYAEAVLVGRSVVLLGDPGDPAVAGPGPDAPVMDGAALGPAIGFDLAPGVDNVTIQGFVIQNYQSSSPGNGIGIRSANQTSDPTTNVVIRDNQLNTNVWAGLMAWNLGENANANWDVSYNVVRMGAWSPNHNVYGIELDNAVDSTISHNIVSGGWDGIVVQAVASGTASIAARNITVSDNEVSDCVDMPIWLLAWKQGSGAVTLTEVAVTGNTVTNAGKMMLANSYSGVIGDLTIEGNHFNAANPGGAGHAVDLGDVTGVSTFSGNTVTISGVIGGGGTFFHAVNICGTATGTWRFEGNELEGNNVGANSVGYRLRNTLPATAAIEITGDTIGGFLRGIQADALATGIDIDVDMCDLAGNSSDGLLNGAGAAVIDATHNWWGAADGPSGTGRGSGVAVSPYVTFSPWWEDAAMTTLRYGDTQFVTDKVIGPGETFRVYGVATIGDGTTGPTWTVNDGTLEVDGLVLTDGASLVVRNGKLILHTSAGTTVIEGTFTIFDSWGTVYFEEDTTVDGDMLALVSHLVFSDGVTLTVNGSLTLDGCVMEGLNDGDTYTVVANDGATFRMYRTEMYDCDLQVNADGAELESNLFNNNVTVGSDADGAMVYHNVFASGSLTDNGSGTITTADGWGNVASQAETANNLALDPAGVDAERNLYIQPGAAVTVTMDVSRLNVPVSGCDALLGYNSYFFEASGTLEVGGGHWEYQIYSNWTEQTLGAVTYGMIDSSIGVGLSAPREGTTDDAAVLMLGLTATTNEGVTKVFFRPPTDGNIPERTLLVSAPTGDPVYVTPFTLNSGYITVDGTVPLAESFTGTQVREGTPVDVFADGEVTGTGTVTFTVDAYDALAGLDPAGPVLTLTNTVAGTSLPVTLVGSTNVDVNGTNYTRYTFTTTVEPTTADGTYDAEVTITDRSGNQTVLTDALTVDVTAPLAQGFTGTQLQESGIVDVFADGAIAQQGALVFTVDVFDALGGLSPDIPVLVLTNVAAGASLTPTYVGSEIVNIGGTNFTRYTFGALVEPTTPNGEYTATITVKDNAGNTASLTDSFTVQKNLCQVTVEIEGADADPFDREVVLVATDSSDSVLATWTRTVAFTNGVGTTDLTEVPDGMAHLSADTAWTLCNRLDASLDVNGQVTVSFTGAEALEGGDVNGDNRVDMLDYARLRYFWYTEDPTTDIDGDGVTSTSDYLILKSNWYQRGDPQ